MKLRGLPTKISRKIPIDYLSIFLSHNICHRTFSAITKQKTFSERMAFRRWKPSPVFGQLSDKFAVRDFVRARFGSDLLIPIYHSLTNVDDFDFKLLPNSYVMKASHGAGWVEIVKDAGVVDVEVLRTKAQGWLRQNYYKNYRERHYKHIKPRIIFEKYLTEYGESPRDYKIHCFRKNGNLTQIIQIHTNRFTDHRINLFDKDWNPIHVHHGFPSASPKSIEKPDNFEQILKIAEIMSEEFNYVRVDLYSISGVVFFGELTFTPGAGLLRFHPLEMDEKWATLFDRDDA